MAFCTKCGTVVDNGANFCSVCGTSFQTPSFTNFSTSPQDPLTSHVSAKSKTPLSHLLIAIGAVIMLASFFAISFIVVSRFTASSKQNNIGSVAPKTKDDKRLREASDDSFKKRECAIKKEFLIGKWKSKSRELFESGKREFHTDMNDYVEFLPDGQFKQLIPDLLIPGCKRWWDCSTWSLSEDGTVIFGDTCSPCDCDLARKAAYNNAIILSAGTPQEGRLAYAQDVASTICNPRPTGALYGVPIISCDETTLLAKGRVINEFSKEGIDCILIYERINEPSKSIEQQNTSNDLVTMSTEELIAKGNQLYDRGNFSKAKIYYEQALKADSTNTGVLVDLGVCFQQIGEPQKALDYYDKAILIDSKMEAALYNKILVYVFDFKSRPDALKALAEFEAVHPNNAKINQLKENIEKLK